MGKKLTKFLNILTFGHLNRKAKKEALKQDQNKNAQLTLNTINLPDIQTLANALGGTNNIASISNTISTITIKIVDMAKVDFNQLKKISIKGVIKSSDNITLLIGDCADALKNKLLGLK